MKQKLISILTLLSIALLLGGCASQGGRSDFTHKGGNLVLEENGLTITLDEKTGMLKEFSSDTDSLRLERVVVDAGLNEAYVFGQLGYTDFSALALSVTLSTSSEADVSVNGVAFLVQGIQGYPLENTTFEFPGSTPDGRIPFSSRTRYRAVSADYSAPVVQVADGSHASNILFVNELEKWTTGCYFDESERPCAAFLSATEGYLGKDSPMEVGTLVRLKMLKRSSIQNPSLPLAQAQAACRFGQPGLRCHKSRSMALRHSYSLPGSLLL